MVLDVIQVRNFSKSFDGRLVHRDVSLSVKPGECMGLVGGSGVGKSVILRSLIGLERADGGQILIEGEDITRYSEEELVPIRKKVAYVFQGGALFDSMSVFDNLAYPLREHTALGEQEIRQTVHSQLAEFGLEGCDQKFPGQLSGGMQKRVGLARAIILRPKVVLYDEPTAGLDPYNTIRIQEVILTMKRRGVTSVFVTHDMPSAFAVCDRLSLLMSGTIQAVGTIEELQKDKSGLLQRFINGELG